MYKIAILVDGGFYLKRATTLFGDKPPKERARELERYCELHIKERKEQDLSLYRVFYYDCPPISKKIYNPLTKKQNDLGISDTFTWMTQFLQELKKKRKFCLRLGSLSENNINYTLKYEATKKLLSNSIKVENLTDKDLQLNITQKGVDMKLGVDIASLAYKNQVDRIVLISGDSDFVPAAKLARREGVDFILDPMLSEIRPDLFEHIDGIRSKTHVIQKEDGNKHKSATN